MVLYPALGTHTGCNGPAFLVQRLLVDGDIVTPRAVGFVTTCLVAESDFIHVNDLAPLGNRVRVLLNNASYPLLIAFYLLSSIY